MQQLPLNLGPRYRALALLANGGMGAVYLGHSFEGGEPRLVAIKVMHAHIADNRDAIELFIDEARIGTRIVHPNVVRILDTGVGSLTGKSGHDTPFIVMEYVEGLSWSRLLRRFSESNERVAPDVVARIVHDSLLGLGAAHALDAVHRDVSPQNILVGVDGHARITDFGVATFTGRISATAPGGIRGKVGYMSPEQVARSGVDGQADLFSAGVVLWEALTGRDLFASETAAETLARVLREPIAPPSSFAPDIGMDLEDVCLKALERSKDRRFRSAQEFADALAAAIPLASTERVAEIVRRLGADALHEQQEARATAAAVGRTPPDDPLPEGFSPPAAPMRSSRTRRSLFIAVSAAILVVVGTFIGRASLGDSKTPPLREPERAVAVSPADGISSATGASPVLALAPTVTAAASSTAKPQGRRVTLPRAHALPASAPAATTSSPSRAKAPSGPFIPGEL